MSSLSRDLDELRRQLKKGSIQRAYAAILSYMQRLRAHFANAQGEKSVSGMYQGYFDMTYFAVFPSSLKSRGLKLAIVFDYESFRFEVWLAARNRKIQRQYWELFKDSGWSKHVLVEPAPGVDAIIQYGIEGPFDLEDPDALTARIDTAASELLTEIETFLGSLDSSKAV